MSKLMLLDDVAFHILSFLPVKSLLRLRCLSKSFCSLIDGPDFINFHLNLSIKTKTNRSLILNNFGSIYEVDLDSPVMSALIIDHQFKRGTDYIFGTCNGLVAMGDDRGIILWNPSTKKHRIVPKFWTGDVCFTNGFGYDVITNDYKVIIVTRAHVHKNDNYSVMVYSLKTNSSKNIHSTPPPYYYECDYNVCYRRLNSVLVGSCVHWAVTDSDDVFNVSYNTMILAFDLGNEKFNEVPLPTPDIDVVVVEGDKFRIKMVAELGGYLSINYGNFCQQEIDIWIMKEYGVKESWIKLFSTSKLELRAYDFWVSLKPLCITKEGNKVFCSDDYGICHILYDLKNRRVESVDDVFRSLRCESPRCVNSAVICVRSLVPLNAEGIDVARYFQGQQQQEFSSFYITCH